MLILVDGEFEVGLRMKFEASIANGLYLIPRRTERALRDEGSSLPLLLPA